ncbi:MAG: methyl-accepting chemotaxis protein [Lentisphaerales bacterium]|nr:methyl-accepting chemotaxis protein [Lentisphaerales bacterium]
MRAVIYQFEPMINGTKENSGLTLIADAQAIAKIKDTKKAAVQINSIAQAIVFGAAIPVFLFSMVINKSIIGLLNKVVESTDKLANKDLTERLELEEAAEIGKMLTSLDEANKSLSEQIVKIRENGHVLTVSASLWTRKRCSFSQDMESLSSDANMVAEASQKMSENMKKVTVSMKAS